MNNRTTFPELSIGERFARPGDTGVMVKVSEGNYQLVGFNGLIGKPRKWRELGELIRVPEDCVHYNPANLK